MARVLITGMSGTGKSTVLGELRRRGHLTVDTDYDGWECSPGVWDEPRMSRLLARHPEIVVAGAAENQGQFYDRYAAVVLLSVPAEVMIERVIGRTNNPYGKTTAEQAEILHHLHTVEPRLRAGATLELDGRQPVAVLADIIARLLAG